MNNIEELTSNKSDPEREREREREKERKREGRRGIADLMMFDNGRFHISDTLFLKYACKNIQFAH